MHKSGATKLSKPSKLSKLSKLSNLSKLSKLSKPIVSQSVWRWSITQSGPGDVTEKSVNSVQLTLCGTLAKYLGQQSLQLETPSHYFETATFSGIERFESRKY